MWLADEILQLLKDGNWHNLRDIAKKCAEPESKVETTVDFLSDYGFVEVNINGGKARLSPLMLEFFDEVQRLEKEQVLNS